MVSWRVYQNPSRYRSEPPHSRRNRCCDGRRCRRSSFRNRRSSHTLVTFDRLLRCNIKILEDFGAIAMFKIPLLAALAVCAFMSAASAGDALSPSELRRLAPGRYAVNVMGLVSMVVSMRPNGIIVGEAEGERDSGNWTVQGQKLCVAWNKWNAGKRRCSTLTGDAGRYSGGGLSMRRI